MSGECDDCGEHTLDCLCETFYLMRKDMEKDPFGGIEPPATRPEKKYINIHGRKEHEAILKDAALCEKLGIDQYYETIVYLKRWGSWLSEE